MHDDELYHFGIKGMKWGVRRYQNEDGSLTPAGRKRFERDQQENAGKKKNNKITKPDPNRWVKEDMERSKKLANASSNMVNQLKNANEKAIQNKKAKSKVDLSSMSDKEMRDQINRKLLEKQYNDLCVPKKISKGREYASKILDGTGTALALTSSALSMALAIKQLRG